MKSIFILTVLFICSNLYSQEPAGWNDEVETYIEFVNEGERIATFSNHYGIHILRVLSDDENEHVKYFRLTSEGGQPSGFSSTGIELDDYGDFPNIVGDENIMYAVYRKDNTIQVQFSTDGGDNWDYLAQNPSSSNASSIESVVNVKLDKPDKGIAPGQFAVFYDGDVCLGGGVILQEKV